MNNKSHNGIEGKISFDEYRVLEINYKLNSEFDSDESIVISFEGDVDGEKFLSNAMAILYPYIRAIVSSYTSLANIPPLTLPTINMQKYLEDSKKINN